MECDHQWKYQILRAFIWYYHFASYFSCLCCICSVWCLLLLLVFLVLLLCLFYRFLTEINFIDYIPFIDYISMIYTSEVTRLLALAMADTNNCTPSCTRWIYLVFLNKIFLCFLGHSIVTSNLIEVWNLLSSLWNAINSSSRSLYLYSGLYLPRGQCRGFDLDEIADLLMKIQTFVMGQLYLTDVYCHVLLLTTMWLLTFSSENQEMPWTADLIEITNTGLYQFAKLTKNIFKLACIAVVQHCTGD